MLSRLDGKRELSKPPSIDANLPMIDLFGVDKRGTSMLGAVGLADASSFGRTIDQLSVGQRARAELGLALLDDSRIILVDEYLAHLDRPTAKAVAWSSQRAIRKSGKTAIFLTAHDDLTQYLQPDLHLVAGWNDTTHIEQLEQIDGRCDLLDAVTIAKGTTADWLKLKPLHYAAGNPATVHSVWSAFHPEIPGPAGVIVCSYPDLHSAARNLATDSKYQNVQDRRVATVLNREVVKVSRIVICPQLRGIGLAGSMLEHVVSSCGARYVECVTSMSRWTRFLERVGFREVPQTCHPIEAELMDWASRERPPAGAHLDGSHLLQWIDHLSVRKRRAARRLVWSYFFHFVLHRRTRGQRPKNVPNPDDERWEEAADLAARRLVERPAYWIIGPIDPMTGLPEEMPEDAVTAA